MRFCRSTEQCQNSEGTSLSCCCRLHVFEISSAYDDAVCYSQIAGRTKSAEAGQRTQNVNIFYTQPLTQIPVYGTFPEINITQVMAIDKQVNYARFGLE